MQVVDGAGAHQRHDVLVRGDDRGSVGSGRGVVAKDLDGQDVRVVRAAGDADGVVGGRGDDARDVRAVAHVVAVTGKGLVVVRVPCKRGEDVRLEVVVVQHHAGVQHGDGDVGVRLGHVPCLDKVGRVQVVLVGVLVRIRVLGPGVVGHLVDGQGGRLAGGRRGAGGVGACGRGQRFVDHGFNQVVDVVKLGGFNAIQLKGVFKRLLVRDSLLWLHFKGDVAVGGGDLLGHVQACLVKLLECGRGVEHGDVAVCAPVAQGLQFAFRCVCQRNDDAVGLGRGGCLACSG